MRALVLAAVVVLVARTHAIANDPKPDAERYIDRGDVWLDKKDYDKAIAEYDEAIRLDPSYAEIYNSRAIAWTNKQEYDKAIADYNEAIRLAPNRYRGYTSAAWLRITCPDERFRNGEEAVELATKACELTGWSDSSVLETLAAAYAETGDFDSAVEYQNKAIIEIDLNRFDAESVKKIKQRLARYKDHKPYRQE